MHEISRLEALFPSDLHVYDVEIFSERNFSLYFSAVFAAIQQYKSKLVFCK
jgi:hypothetical protein